MTDAQIKAQWSAACKGGVFNQPVAKALNPPSPAAQTPHSCNSQAASTAISSAAASKPGPGSIALGVIKRVMPGAQSVEVDIDGAPGVAAVMATGVSNVLTGASDVTLPVEGSLALVWTPPGGMSTRCIVGIMPPLIMGVQSVKKRSYASDQREQSVGYFASALYDKIMSDEKYRARAAADARRTFESLPGDWIKQSKFGVTALIGDFMARLSATPGASLDFCVFDDMVRLTTGLWKHHSAIGDEIIYNDGGFLTRESGFTGYWPERLGRTDYGDGVTDGTKADDVKGKSRYQASEAKAAPRQRWVSFDGHLGDLRAAWLQNPLDGTPGEGASAKYGEKAKHPGLGFSGTLGDGSVVHRSAGGIALVRTDRIPVPARIADPWDPAGDKPEDEQDIFQPKTPFQYPESHPYARNLMRRDAEAWRTSQIYQRFDELPKDFHVPEEADTEISKDEYDYNKSEAKFTDNKDRRVGIWMDPDGSFHMVDAWGAEIYTRGGHIILACPGDVMLQPGKSLVALAGQDVVLKAKGSVDVSATDHDVRVAAKGNLHMLSLERGVLIESRSKGAYHGFDGESEGEDVYSHGVTIKAKDSAIAIWAKSTYLLFADQLVMKATDLAKGSITAVASKIFAVFDKTCNIVSSGAETLLQMSKSYCTVNAPKVGVYGHNVSILKDGKAPQWISGGASPYEEVKAQWQPIAASYYPTDDWLGNYAASELENVGFTFRTSDQCGTAAGREVYSPGDNFALYEACWQSWKRQGYKFINAGDGRWAEWDVDGTYPWPGSDARGGCHFQAGADVNVTPTTGVAKKRSEVTDTPAEPTPVGMDEYVVLQ